MSEDTKLHVYQTGHRPGGNMKTYVNDNPRMKIALDCKFAVTIHWDNNSYTLKTYKNQHGERYIKIHGKRYYL